MSFSEAKENNLRVSFLDSSYRSGIQADSSLSVFKAAPDEYIAAYQSMLQELGKYLHANGFDWEKPVKGFNRIYFDKTGKIDYFLYSFREGQLTAEQEKRFAELLGKFITSYRFSLSADTGFAQCSPVTYLPISK
jgi:hypothetical protein